MTTSAASWPAPTFQTTFEAIKNDYRAAKQTRFTPRLTGTLSTGSGADYHYKSEWHYLHMMERSRHWERNDPTVGQGIRRFVSNVIQEGFQPDPKTGNPDLDKVLKEKWAEYSTSPDLCHSEGELTFHQQERLVLRSIVRDGDIFSLLLDNGTIQFVEGHRPRTPSRTMKNVVHGLLLDDDARRQEVWISKEDLNLWSQVSRVQDVVKYPMRDEEGNRVVLQCYFPDRTSQRRGIGALAPVSDIIGMHDDLQFATLVKAQLASLIVLLREQDKDAPGTSGPPIGNLATTAAPPMTRKGGIKPIGGIQAGLDVTSEPGEKISGFSPNIPGANFFEHTALLLTFMSINLDLPLQVFLLEPKANFSAWRGAIDQARMRFFEIQRDLMNQFHTPVWQWKVRQWMSESSALRGMAEQHNYLKHTWRRPAFAYIEPKKDAEADGFMVDKFLSSPRRILGYRGEPIEEVYEEWLEDRKTLLRGAMVVAQELNTEFADSGITWRDVLSPDVGSQPRAAAPVVDPNAEEGAEDAAAAKEDTQKSAARKKAGT